MMKPDCCFFCAYNYDRDCSFTCCERRSGFVLKPHLVDYHNSILAEIASDVEVVLKNNNVEMEENFVKQMLKVLNSRFIPIPEK